MPFPISAFTFDNTKPVDRLEDVLTNLQTEVGALESGLLTNVPWTPTITIGGSSLGIAYSLQTGRAFRFGSLAHVECDLQLSSKGGLTGAVILNGLPFSAVGMSNTNIVDPVTGWTLAGNNTPYVDISGTTAVLLWIVGGARLQVGGADLANTAFIRFSATYSI